LGLVSNFVIRYLGSDVNAILGTERPPSL
jgi:hypothetical protein